MYTEEITFSITDINSNKSISIAMDTTLYNNGVQVNKTRHRCAFIPGQIEAVKAYTGWVDCPELDYLNAVWTQEVIDTYNTLFNLVD